MVFNSLIIRARDVAKAYGNEPVLTNFNIDIWRGGIFGILGMSGSGKTTALRLIAGFDRPDTGRIEMSSRVLVDDIQWIPPEERNIGMVFQDYALFPHLTVEKNISFGLTKEEIKNGRIEEVLDLCSLKRYRDKFPQEVSGGQQQRVALARALAPNPEIILLDEPFTSLDAHMARDLREELVSLLRDTETTAVLVTHDQEEALSVCDIVSVLEDGEIIQSATPQEIYLNPVSQNVANSVGDPNILKGISRDGKVATKLGTFACTLDGKLNVSIRPECILLNLDLKGEYQIKECIFYGHDQIITFENEDGDIFRSRMGPTTIYESGDKVNINVTEVTTFPA